MTRDGLRGSGTPPEESADRTLEASALPVDYEGRPGYGSRFLDQAEEVPLPGILPGLMGQLAYPYQYEEPWLRYWTYSVLMARERRLPVVSAANFDRTSEKANDRPGAWTYDSRLGATQAEAEARQVGNNWYKHQPLMDTPRPAEFIDLSLAPHNPGAAARSPFDRGHLTAYEHADFGDNGIAAGKDTFHFTNCAPQAWRFNQHRIWRQIERWTADKGNGRLCFFSGPVFDAPMSELRDDGEFILMPLGERAADPVVNEVAVPKQFFKVCAYLVRGRVQVQSLVVTQEDFLRPFLSSEFDTLEVTPEQLWLYRVALPDVTHLTGLDFGPLAEIAETVNGQSAETIEGQALRHEPELISSLDQI